MAETISMDWRASANTINSLKRAGYTDKQRKRILIEFIKRFGGQQIDNASSRYSKWVMKESAHGITYTKPQAEIDQEEKREQDLKNKSLTGSVVPRETMTNEQALEWYNQQRHVT